jgi:hypothetical protein
VICVFLWHENVIERYIKELNRTPGDVERKKTTAKKFKRTTRNLVSDKL